MSEKIQASPHYEEYRQGLEDELKASFSARQGFLYDLLRYHLGWSDERGQPQDQPRPRHFQPLLALATCEALCGDFHPALPVAAAIELVYNFTLVHGDVQAGRVDPSDRPSIWWVWGPAQAINAGDGLHALGRTTIMGLAQRGVPAERVLRSVEALDLACLSLCEGQYLDLTFQDQLMVTSSDYYDMIRHKSGALTGCAAELGALASGADDQLCALFRDLGTKLGMAWQITQDIADLWGRHGDGATASNVLNKKKSLPIIHALETSGVPIKRELGNIYMKRVLEHQDTARIIAILEQANAGQYAEDQARVLVEQALETLEGAGLSDEQRQSFKPLGQWALDGLDNLSP